MRLFSSKTGGAMLAALVVVAAASAVMIGGASATRTASTQVCALLPDTKSSVRWTAVRRSGPLEGVQECGHQL